jgi:DNA-binding MarR family transcriptional regulator
MARAKAPERQPPPGAVIGGVDIRAVASCRCLGLRRSAREATQLFDSRLVSVGLTVGQFGILARLYGLKLGDRIVTMKELAELVGMDPTTMVRALKPLEQQRLVSSRPDPEDGRARLIELSALGEKRLAAAAPIWAEAHAALEEVLGDEAVAALGKFFKTSGKQG